MATTILNTTTRVGDVNPAAGALGDSTSQVASEGMPLFGKTAQVTTLTADSASNSTAYTVSIGEDAASLTSFTFTSDADATVAEIADGLAAAAEATAGVNNLVSASSDGVDTVTFTGRVKGQSFTVSESSGDLSTSTTTSAADATSLPFGCFAEVSSRATTVGTRRGCAAMGTGTYTAKVITVDVDGAGTLEADDTIEVIVGGDFDGAGYKQYSAKQTYATSQDATLDEMVLAINGALPASSVLVASTPATATALTFTGELAGLDFDVQVIVYDDSESEYTTLSNTVTSAVAIPEGAGIVIKSLTVEQDSSGDADYGSGDSPSLLQHGKVWVRLDDGETVAIGDPVWVRITASGTEKAGAFSVAADSTDCLPLSAWGFKGTWLTTNKAGFDGNDVALLHIQRA